MAKILVISDTHGRTACFERILPGVQPVDYLFHLGDVGADASYIESMAGCPCCFVAGNNDYFSGLPKERLVRINGWTIFMTHGHNYYVSSRKHLLAQAAAMRGAQIALFGHTHVPFAQEEEGVLLLNPGSLSLPRQEGHCPTYLLLELEEGTPPRYQFFEEKKC